MSKCEYKQPLKFPILTFLIISIAKVAGAYSCPPQQPFSVAFASSPVIALAEVLEIRGEPEYLGRIVSLQIHAAWKGSLSGRQEIRESGLGGFRFKEGEQYLIYGGIWEGQFVSDICTRTREYSRAEEDILLLGRPKWSDSADLKLFPKKTAGLTVLISAAPHFNSCYEVGFNLTLKNESGTKIFLPGENESSNLIDIVVRHNGDWWTTMPGGRLRGWAGGDWREIGPGRKKQLALGPRDCTFWKNGPYTAQAVVHFSTSMAGRWSGYVFSNSVAISVGGDEAKK